MVSVRQAATTKAAVVVASVGVAAVVVVAVTAIGSRDPAGVAEPATAPLFVDDTPASGVDHAYTGDFDFFVGGGVAAFDCDDDGFEDLFLAGGAAPAALFRNTSAVGGALTFARVVSAVTDLTRVSGAYPIDVDSDGIVDLAVLRNGRDELLRGLGGCRFESITDELGWETDDSWTVGFSATWEGANRLPTLAFANYLVRGTDECDAPTLLRPASDDRYAPAVRLEPGWCALSALFSDWGRTGNRDLRITNDRHYALDAEEQLWHLGAGRPRLFTADDGWQPLRIWGMGIASDDVTGDGLPDVFLTSQGDNKLQTLAAGPGAPTYRDIALRLGVTAQRPAVGDDVLPSTAWHPEFGDVNNDGYSDLLITKGNVDAQDGYAVRDPDDLLLGTPDGTFREAGAAAGVADFRRSRGAVLTDLNLDGMLDLVVVHRREPATIWRNVGLGTADRPAAMGHWLGFRLAQPAPNGFAVGAWIEIRIGDRTITREAMIGGGHASGHLGWHHVGLGGHTSADVRVQWPDGRWAPWVTVAADRFVTISADDTPTVWPVPETHDAS